MTLRWRLTIVYTALMVLLLAAIAASVYGALAGYLDSNIRRELQDNLALARKQVQASGGQGIDCQAFPSGVFVQRDTLLPGDSFLNGLTECIESRGLNAIRLDEGGYAALERFRQQGTPGTFVGRIQVQLPESTVPALVMAYYNPASERVVQPADGVNRATVERLETVIYVARPLAQYDATLAGLRNILLVVGTFGVAAAALGSYSVAGRALGPLRAVRDEASKITGRELSRRVPEPGTNDEVDALAHAINRMLARLEDSFETQRRFTADASHELRTPVTAIKGHADYLLRRTGPSPAQRESLVIVRSEAERLTKLVGDLLELARADAGFPLDKKLFALVPLAEEVHLEVAPIAGTTVIEVVGPRSAAVVADPQRVRQVLLNLVQNAIKAGAATVRISIEEPDDSVVRLRVQDDGPGIPPEHLPHLFDRFYRIDTARNRAAGGSGLGLSIVKWIVEAHGGMVEVSSTVGVGTRFEVVLPSGGRTPPPRESQREGLRS